MKKILVLLMAVCLAAPLFAQNYEKTAKKAQQREFKAKLNGYKKKGYEIMGSRTLDVALAKHYQKLAELGENGQEYYGYSTKTKSKNLGEQAAFNNATIKYAQLAGSTVKGRILSDNSVDMVANEGEFEKFFSIYERLVEQKVKNVMQHSYSVIKDNGDGTYEVQSFFIVEESAARKARSAALEGALKDTQALNKYAKEIRKYTDERLSE